MYVLHRASTALHLIKKHLELDSSADLNAITRTARQTGRVEDFNDSFVKLYANKASGNVFVLSEVTHCKLANEIIVEKLSFGYTIL